MSKLYINVADYQGGTWSFGCVGDIKYWQERALGWCESDDNEELFDVIKSHKLDNELLDIINDIWTMDIVEFKRENIDRILESYDEDSLAWLLINLMEILDKNKEV